ncbi:hypothetical protein L4D77_06145 [Photobacterium frigidiphilum]|uniref:hypothetical protein n=1 Tax=Photobacterium frigidiphilum TaxID=264736 RepID=UPI003D12EC72
MTEKTLSQRLPVGAARNKVEFLADEFEKTAADLYQLISDIGGNNKTRDPHVFGGNLLKNAGFLGAIDGQNNYGNRWGRPYATHENNDSISFLQQIAAPVCPNWGGEVRAVNGQPCAANFESHMWNSITGGALEYGSHLYQQVLFQVFRLPCIDNDKLKKMSCYVRLMSGGGNERTRFGIVQLDENMKAVGYVASKIVSGQGTHNKFDEWLDDIDLSMTACPNFAFFVERLDHMLPQKSFIYGAGLSLEGTPFIPEIAHTHIDFDDQKFFKITSGIKASDFVENMVIPFPSFDCPNGVNNHITVNVVDETRATTALSPDITMKVTDSGLLLTNVTGGYVGDVNKVFDVEGFYTKYINKIHYFDMPDYVAA